MPAPAAQGSRAVLEVRSREVPFILEHGQIVGRLVYEKMLSRPECDVRPAHRLELSGAGPEALQAFSGVAPMRRTPIAVVALIAVALASTAAAQTETPNSTATSAQMAEYLVKLAEYDAARAAYQVLRRALLGGGEGQTRRAVCQAAGASRDRAR